MESAEGLRNDLREKVCLMEMFVFDGNVGV